MNVAIIPARGGSKRIPRKNIRNFCGKPIIAWPIETAKNSGLFDYIMVSTDDEEIAEISKSYGAEVPFIRAEELSTDYAVTTEVIANAITWMMNKGWKLNSVCCIYPTSVFIGKEELNKGLVAIETGNWKYAFSVTKYEYPIFRAFKVADNGGVRMFFPEYFKTRSQDLTEAIHDAAQFYWGIPDAWLKGNKIFDIHSLPIMIPYGRTQDIDTLEDWQNAEFLFRSFIKSPKKNE